MNVKDLLMCFTPEEIAKAIIKMYDHEKPKYDLYIDVIEKFRDTEPANSDCVIIGVDYNIDGEKCFDAAMYKKNEVRDNLEKLKAIANVANIKGLTDEELHALVFEGIPCAYAIDFEPWENTLGSAIIEENAEQVGKLRLCAAIICEMTFCGFSKSDAASILNEAKEIADNITKNDIKNAIKNAKPVDWLADFGVDPNDIVIDKRKIEEEQLFYNVSTARALVPFFR